MCPCIVSSFTRQFLGHIFPVSTKKRYNKDFAHFPCDALRTLRHLSCFVLNAFLSDYMYCWSCRQVLASGLWRKENCAVLLRPYRVCLIETMRNGSENTLGVTHLVRDENSGWIVVGSNGTLECAHHEGFVLLQVLRSDG